ncbi:MULTISPECIES: AfsR/SARP family transcriptional regulator [Kitasatospora]|uniref:Putative AfsR family transcriptional regulator n=1 Tax=Kitasatospora setae (strain ATCC 33774 / DSM 43861 / JCM 3304 / KCC A-0304 / NBRC 14216 / KM-6054) TaxID=452652 RepID=E4N2X9_KITSK|nr:MULTISPECIES: AfsR/SARP family transcriptional regulator [Kitasatospora]BAJ32513.1 putative AfsR family transcriptional regulator [Kitasatospora setae KM-6054]
MTEIGEPRGTSVPEPDGGEPLRLGLLGPVQAWRGERELELGPPQQRALLTALALRARRIVSVDELLDALWEEPPARAATVVRTYVSRLRRVLEPARAADRAQPTVLVSSGSGYVLRLPADRVDAEVFENRVAAAGRARAAGDPAGALGLLREACGLWHGEPLAGLPGPFAQAHRARLVERRLNAVQAWLEAELEAGRHADVIGELTVWVSQYPLLEPMRELLMLALYRSGRQAEALGVYADARRTLVEQLGVDPGPRLRELHLGVLSGDPRLAAPVAEPAPVFEPGGGAGGAGGPGGGAAGVVLVPPAQLPADISDYTGRDELCAALCADLAPDGPTMPVVGVSGLGGVGKSTLAVHVAHAVGGQYPDGQLYVNLRGAGAFPADPGEVLAGFLGALGVADAAVPQGTAERAALFRSRLAGLRVLIVLDDARDSRQVGPLLPGSRSCAVLVTSRAWLAGMPMTRQVGLEPLSAEESVRLLTAIAGEARVAAEPAAARRVAAACGFLPLAVRTAASRLAARPAWQLSHMADRLASERRRLAELATGELAVAASFRLSYDQLDPEAARAFRLLSLADGPGVSSAAAAVLLELPEPAAERLAESLTDLGLLSCPFPGRYQYHDLLRLFARELVREVDGEAAGRAAVERLLRHYLAAVAGLYRVVRPGYPFPDLVAAEVPEPEFAGPAEGLRWIRQEVAAVLAVAGQAVRDPEGPLAVVADLTLVLIQLIDLGMAVPELCELAGRVAGAAQAAGLAEAEVRARYTLMWAQREFQRTSQARAEAVRVVALARRTGQAALLPGALIVLALTGIPHGADEEVAARCEEAVALSAELGNPSAHAFVEGMAALADLAVGRAESARRRAERSLAAFKGLGDFVGQVHMLYARATALHELGRFEAACEDYRECLAALRTLGAWDRVPGVLVGLAESCRAAGRPEQALEAAEQALAIARKVGLEHRRANALAAIGRALFDLGEHDRGRACLA